MEVQLKSYKIVPIGAHGEVRSEYENQLEIKEIIDAHKLEIT